MEPPNNGHSGDRPLVYCREVVPISEVKPCMLQLVGGNQFELQTTVCPFHRGCLLLGVSIIGSSTVCNNYVQGEKALEQDCRLFIA